MSSALKLALLLLVATLLAVAARTFYVNSQQQAQAAPDPTINIMVAAADLPTGLLLRDSDLAWRQVKESAAPKGALIEGSSQAQVGGALLRNKLEAGALIRAADLILPDTPGFLAAALKPGMLAVSVPVDDVSGNAGLIQPGDYVDMILTQRLDSGSELTRNAERQVVSETVVRQVRVIAVGSSFQRDATDKTGAIRARTITIEVRPAVAEAVTVAADLGSLSLALRSFATDERDPALSPEASEATVVAWGQNQGVSGPVWGADVSNARRELARQALENTPVPAPEAAPAAAAPVPEPRRRRISVFQGGELNELDLTPEGAAEPAPEANHPMEQAANVLGKI